MPATMTYNSLVEDIKGYCERPNDTKLALQIPRIIMIGENRVAADLRILGIEKVVVAALTLNNPAIAKPSYWRTNISFNITHPVQGRVELLPRTYEYCRNYWPDPALTGVPRFYADYNSQNFLVVPTPDAAYPMELIYNARQDPLDASNQTNWLTMNAPQLLLYVCLAEAQLYLKNYQQFNSLNATYEALKGNLKAEDAEHKTDRTTVA